MQTKSIFLNLFALTSAWTPLVFFPHGTTAIKPLGFRTSRGSHSTPVRLPIHILEKRSPANNTAFGAGVGDVSLSEDRQTYFTTIEVGGISFHVALDTASSDLWLLSTDCETESCTEAPRYPLAYHSPTFSSINENKTDFSISYLDNSYATGFVARETVQLADMTSLNQAFGLVSSSNVSLTDKMSGIMGLGFPRLSTISDGKKDTLPFFSTLATEARVEYPIFGLSLTRNFSGMLALGAIDATVVSNPSLISWNKVAQFPPFGRETSELYLHWAIPLSGISVSDTLISPIPTYSAAQPSLALFDVGAPGIYGPYQDVSRIFAAFEGARLVDTSGRWAVPCSSDATLVFTFNKRGYTLQPSDYIIGPASGNPNLCLAWPQALPPSPDGIDWQMGSAFLRTIYTVFSYGINDKEPPMIGLYPLHEVNIQSNLASSGMPTRTNVESGYLSATVATTLPNFVLATPTFTTPPYLFNSSASVSIGGIVSSGLANSTYTPLLRQQTTISNISALPLITPPPSVVTLLLTASNGQLSTTTSTASRELLSLGIPPGWKGDAMQSHVSIRFALVSALLGLTVFLS